ncbi:receptor-type tyrosine-protein phosphatase R isoform X2 [Callorhinchus milii]|uniref:receptor-type tyrosine-protein phosphatase R isoform X2 n=1 Tax=Callorhinchus milii TaxID=7868 RepID=UPI001C3F867F|nr:receptor-type tyrosine-protein phosphatase R isoform X2 [Callorhinchus milii]
MQGRPCILLWCALLRLQTAGCLSGNHDHFKTRSPRRLVDDGKPVNIYHHVQTIDKSMELRDVEMHRSRISMEQSRQNLDRNTDRTKRHPAMIIKSSFPLISSEQPINFVANSNHHLEIENLPVPEGKLILVAMQMDVRKVNITLLRIFREGIAAALGLLPQQVHINHLNEKKNCIEFYVSSMNDKTGMLHPVPSEEVMQSLNVNILHQSLSQFSITQVTPEKNVLHGEHGRDGFWSKEGFYAVVIFLTVFVIVVTCLLFLYRLKEKIPFQFSQEKQQNQRIDLSSMPVQPPQLEVKTAHSMVQPGLSTVTVSVDSPSRHVPDIKPCTSSSPSPFKMKPGCLQERRGSNVSLTLDMNTLGSVETFSIAPTPRERISMEYLQFASRTLTRQQLREIVESSQYLEAEFTEIPMNFVNPKELNIPCHGTKNRYKTILPNPHSRVCLKPKSSDESLSSTYINANYIRGYGGEKKVHIATQGPMINTVNDFWQMVWQEDSPAIVMITKLKEKNEKCVLYWPEKRGIYGRVEVLVNCVDEWEHCTVRDLTLKVKD